MAWPCLGRVCCLARRGGPERSDLAVPLTLRPYSDIEAPPAAAPPGSPGPPRTQYQRDFGAPRRAPPAGSVLPGGRGDPPPPRLRAPPDAAPPPPATTSYRQEYQPWPATKPSRPMKTKPTSVTMTDYTVRESSYRADFKVPEGRRKFLPNPSAVFQASPAPILHV